MTFAIFGREKTLKSPAAISLYVRRPEIFQQKSRGGRWKAFPYVGVGGRRMPRSHGHRETLREEVGLLAAVCPP